MLLHVAFSAHACLVESCILPHCTTAVTVSTLQIRADLLQLDADKISEIKRSSNPSPKVSLMLCSRRHYDV
jgi:hypothetical protein